MIKKVCKKEISVLFVLYLIILKHLIRKQESSFTIYLLYLITSFSIQKEIKSQVRSKKTPDNVKKDFDICGKEPINNSKTANLRSGSYYYNARWYDPSTGRFITEDPARDGLNWFIYVNNNPLRFVDPTGLLSDEHRAAMADLAKWDVSTEKIAESRSYYEGQERTAIDQQMELMAFSADFDNEKTREILLGMMGDYNRDIIPQSLSDYSSDGTLTGGFDQTKGYEGVEKPHPGIDWIGSNGVKTPFYTIYESSNINQSSHPVVLSIPGTDMKIRIKHSDAASVQGLVNKKTIGGGFLSLAPGQEIMRFPSQNNGKSSTSPHFHLEMTANRGPASDPRRFINPIGLQTGKSVEYEYNKGTVEKPDWIYTNRYF